MDDSSNEVKFTGLEGTIYNTFMGLALLLGLLIALGRYLFQSSPNESQHGR